MNISSYLKSTKRLLGTLVILLFASTAFSQMSYEEYKASYKPHYNKIAPNAQVVTAFNNQTPGVGAAGIKLLLENIDNNEDVQDSKLKIVAMLTSMDRSLVGQILQELTAQKAIDALALLKSEWILELAWFTDVNTYHDLAAGLTALKTYKINDGFLGQNSSKWMPIYAGIGYDRAWGGYSAMNKYIDGYNGTPNKMKSDNTPISLTEELNKMGTTNGIDLFGAFYKTGKNIIELQFQSRKAVSKGGGVDWNRSFSFGSNALNVLVLTPSKHTYSSFVTYQGWGIHAASGSVRTKNDIGMPTGKLGGGSTIGGSYNVGMFINPIRDLPVMIGLRAYAQINLLSYNVSFLQENNPQPGVDSKLKSLNNLYGLQFQAIYKFPAKKSGNKYPSFTEEVIARMDKHINTKYDELSPTISPDGRTLYFVREKHPLNTNGTSRSQDIWVADISNGMENAISEHMGLPFNTEINNSIAGVSPDENTMMIKGFFKNGVRQKSGYSFVHRTIDGWSTPEGIEVKDYENMNKGRYVAQYWTQDGKHLILGFSEIASVDYTKLYVSHLQSNGTWSRPINLGKTINTDGADVHSPYMASDGKTLYYSSNRDGGLGSNDIWMSKRLDDTWTNWSEPENLGEDVNTSAWDAYYSIDASGRYAYMVSYKNSISGSADIVRIELKEEVRPDPVVLIRGKVFDEKTKEPIGATIVYNGIEDGVNYGIARTNPKNGEYKIVLPYGVNYDITASAPSYIGVSENLDLRKVGEYKEVEKDLALVPIEVGSVVRLNNIFFEFGKADLQEESFSELNRVVTFMTDNPTVKIELSGHTDNVGSDATNNKLSQDRVNSVKKYLIEKGIDENRMTAKGYGKAKPVATNDTEEGRQLNRRVEFSILEK